MGQQPDVGRDDRNLIVLEGRVSAEPERRDLPSGDHLIALRVVVRRPDGSRVDSLPVAVGPAPARGGRKRPGQAGRREVTRAASLAEDDRVRVEGWVERRFWAAGGARRSRLQVVATSIERISG